MEERRAPGRFKVKFTAAEDFRLMKIVNEIGSRDWPAVASQMCGRNARQCRERWTNYINPAIVNAPWSEEEERLLEEKLEEFGTRWQAIAIFFPTRSKNHIKNHWSYNQKRKLTRKPAMKVAATEKRDPGLPTQDSQLPVRSPALCNIFFTEEQNEENCWEDIFAGFF
jgi:hypothetical protein